MTLGDEARSAAHLRRPGPERTLTASRETLERFGFEPFAASDDEIGLRNCPFRDLAQRAPDLVCEMNRAFVEGFVRGLGNETVQAVIDRQPGACCVRIRTARARAS